MNSITLGALAIVLCLCAVLRRMTPRISALEAEIAEFGRSTELSGEVRHRQQAMLDNIPDLVWLKDAEHRYLIVNKAFGQACGLSPNELVGRTATDVWPLDLAENYRHDDALVLASGTRRCIEEHLEYRTGERKWIETIKMPVVDRDGRVIGTSGIARDISERKQLQEIMAQRERMATVGGLAAGMAHELNTPLGAILQHVQNIRRRVSAGLPANETAAREIGVDFDLVRQYLDRRGIDEMLGHITEAGSRAADIITSLQAFSRTGGVTLEATPLSGLIDGVIELAACDHDLGDRYNFPAIAIIRDYDQSLPPIEMNRREMERVLLIILKNAAQALAGGEPPISPQILLTTRLAGRYARIDIADNGPGMSGETARRVFEPFFTTRATGAGSGLGLSTAYALVVDNHRGLIGVDSTPGRGATFTISLPLETRNEAFIPPPPDKR